MSPLAVLLRVLGRHVPFLIYYLDFDFTVSKTATGRLTEFAEAAIASRTRMLAIESAGESGTGLPLRTASDASAISRYWSTGAISSCPPDRCTRLKQPNE